MNSIAGQAVAPDQPRSDDRSSRESRVRWGNAMLYVAILFLSVFGGFAPSAEAQTAYFSGATTTVHGLFNYPEGAAVDASGNVYIADTYNGAVDEIVRSMAASLLRPPLTR